MVKDKTEDDAIESEEEGEPTDFPWEFPIGFSEPETGKEGEPQPEPIQEVRHG